MWHDEGTGRAGETLSRTAVVHAPAQCELILAQTMTGIGWIV
jgi:hypothetical protein